MKLTHIRFENAIERLKESKTEYAVMNVGNGQIRVFRHSDGKGYDYWAGTGTIVPVGETRLTVSGLNALMELIGE